MSVGVILHIPPDVVDDTLFSEFVYDEEIKRESKRRPIYECRCDERLKGKAEGPTRLGYTGLCGGPLSQLLSWSKRVRQREREKERKREKGRKNRNSRDFISLRPGVPFFPWKSNEY
jgi:hypothetical protein